MTENNSFENFKHLQNKFREYVENGTSISLKDLINDTVVAYSYNFKDRINKHEEHLKRCKKLLKRISKIKDKEELLKINLEIELGEIFRNKQNRVIDNSVTFVPSKTDLEMVEYLNEINKECEINPKIATEDIKTLRKMPEFIFKELTLNRNLSPSSSHNHVYKKFEQQTTAEEPVRNIIFQNGVINQRITDSPPNTGNLFFKSSIEKNKKEN